MLKNRNKGILLGLIGASLLLSACGGTSSSQTSSSSSKGGEASSSSSSYEAVCSLSLVYDSSLLMVEDLNGNDLLKEYDNGTKVSFTVASLDASYDKILVSVNGVDWPLNSGSYSFSITRDTIIHVRASIVSYSVSTVSQDATIVFTDADGKTLTDQKGSYLGGQTAYFKLANKGNGGFLGIHNIVVSSEDKALKADAKGIYSIAEIHADQTIEITANLHRFTEEGKETTTGQSAESLLFASSSNCTVNYVEGLGYKVLAEDTASDYEIRFDPAVVSYFLNKGTSNFSWAFGNGRSFLGDSFSTDAPSPVNCAMEWYAFGSDGNKYELFEKVDSIKDKYTRPSFWGRSGDDDLCTCSLDLLDTYTDIRLFVNTKDAAGDVAGASYISSVSFSKDHDCFVSTQSDEIKLLFTDSSGTLLADQSGGFYKGDDVYFKLGDVNQNAYIAFHNIVVKNGDAVLSADANGLYSVKSISSSLTLTLDVTSHAFNDEGNETTTGLSAAHYLFGASKNCTVSYVENLGWKIICLDTGSGYEIAFDPAVVAYYLGKKLPLFSWAFGNGLGFVDSYNASNPNPVNCAMEWYAFDSSETKYELFEKVDSIKDKYTRPSAWGPTGDNDLCTTSLLLDSTYSDIRLFVSPTDATNALVGASYIYSALFAAEEVAPAKSDYFAPASGGTVTYTEGTGWKVSFTSADNSFTLQKEAIAYNYKKGMTKLKLTFGPAFAGDTCGGNPEQCTLVIHAFKKDGSQGDYLTAWIHTLTSEGDSKYSTTIDLNNADWAFANHQLKFYVSYNDISGVAVGSCFIYGVDFS